jgi:hypothetical protein
MTDLTHFLLHFDPSSAVPAALLVCTGLAWFVVPRLRKHTEVYFLLALAFIVSTYIIGSVLFAIRNSIHARYDLYIYQFDSAFGQPSFALGTWLSRHLLIYGIAAFTYRFLGVSTILALLPYAYCRTRSELRQAIAPFVLNAVLAPLIYIMIPVSGPCFAFPVFPNLPTGIVTPHVIALIDAPNCIPSIHMSTALLILWFLRHWWWGRIVGLGNAVFTVLGTLGGGQHYLFDLLCAVPYTFGVIWLTHDEPTIETVLKLIPSSQSLRAKFQSQTALQDERD